MGGESRNVVQIILIVWCLRFAVSPRPGSFDRGVLLEGALGDVEAKFGACLGSSDDVETVQDCRIEHCESWWSGRGGATDDAQLEPSLSVRQQCD